VALHITHFNSFSPTSFVWLYNDTQINTASNQIITPGTPAGNFILDFGHDSSYNLGLNAIGNHIITIKAVTSTGIISSGAILVTVIYTP